jgi:hypothetical protein
MRKLEVGLESNVAAESDGSSFEYKEGNELRSIVPVQSKFWITAQPTLPPQCWNFTTNHCVDLFFEARDVIRRPDDTGEFASPYVY